MNAKGGLLDSLSLFKGGLFDRFDYNKRLNDFKKLESIYNIILVCELATCILSTYYDIIKWKIVEVMNTVY